MVARIVPVIKYHNQKHKTCTVIRLAGVTVTLKRTKEKLNWKKR